MRYHFVVNGYSEECLKQIQEQKGFQEQYLSGMEEGTAFIYCRDSEEVRSLGIHHTEQAVFLTAPQYVPEAVLEKLCACMKEGDLYIFGSDFSAGELVVRAAMRTNGSSVSAVHGLDIDKSAAQNECECSSERLLVKKMVYSNHMEGIFSMEKGPYCISLAKGMERAEAERGSFAIESRIVCCSGAEHVLSSEFYPEESERGLEDAQVVVAAGRGAKNKENVAVMERVAKSMGGELGLSRPAAMNAWAPMNRLIGVSGAMIGPDICITAGVSGASAFNAGVEKSKFIVAINTDEKAPIMKMADVAVVDDAIPVLEALEEIIKK